MNIHQLKQQALNNFWFGENRRSVQTLHGLVNTALVMPDTSKIWGIDISHWNMPVVDLIRMKELYNLQFVIIKGCDGSIVSRYSAQHKAAAKEAGLPWGYYDWLYPHNRVNIDAQVTAWHNQAAADPPPMGIFIDAENTTYMGQPANPNATDLRMAHDRLKVKQGRSATTYTSQGYADFYLRGFDWSREELWIANYGVSVPSLPTGANFYTLWQFAATLDGHTLDPDGNAELDGNYFNGSQAQFNAKYGTVTPEPPPDTGEPMPEDKYFKVTTGTLNIRSSPENLGGANDLGTFNLLQNDIIHAVELVINGTSYYHRIAKIWRGGVVVPFASSPTGQYWAAEKVGLDTYMVETTNPVPPAGDNIHLDADLKADGTITGTWTYT